MQGAVLCLSVMMVSLSGFAVIKGSVWRLKRHEQPSPIGGLCAMPLPFLLTGKG